MDSKRSFKIGGVDNGGSTGRDEVASSSSSASSSSPSISSSATGFFESPLLLEVALLLASFWTVESSLSCLTPVGERPSASAALPRGFGRVETMDKASPPPSTDGEEIGPSVVAYKEKEIRVGDGKKRG